MVQFCQIKIQHHSLASNLMDEVLHKIKSSLISNSYLLNISEWVPVRVISITSSSSSCCHRRSQSDCMWHSQIPLIVPASLCGLYDEGRHPSLRSKLIAAVNFSSEYPRFLQSFRSLLNCVVARYLYLFIFFLNFLHHLFNTVIFFNSTFSDVIKSHLQSCFRKVN